MSGEIRRFKSYWSYKDSRVAWLGEIPSHWNLSPVSRGTILPHRAVAKIDMRLVPGMKMADAVAALKARSKARGWFPLSPWERGQG